MENCNLCGLFSAIMFDLTNSSLVFPLPLVLELCYTKENEKNQNGQGTSRSRIAAGFPAFQITMGPSKSQITFIVFTCSFLLQNHNVCFGITLCSYRGGGPYNASGDGVVVVQP